MESQALERHGQGTVSVELCFTCAGIWFDHLASVELAPAAVISLFKQIHAHQDTPRQPVSGTMNCPRCPGALVLSFDVAKSGRFSYFRCARGDGRFTPFVQFLREKQFIRSLTPVEVQQIKAQKRPMTCSQCGAPVDLELGTECTYCHTPLSLLDPDAVEKAVRMWSAAQDREHKAPSPGAVAEALLKVQGPTAQGSAPGAWHAGRYSAGVDLVSAGIDILGTLLQAI
jgi:hypothetical protein